MVSVTSVTDKYILQPTLIAKHKKTMEWISSTVLWKHELSFFQKILDEYAHKFSSVDDKKQIDHFQNIILYYSGELIDSYGAKLRLHEKILAEMLETRDESNIAYFKDHDELMSQLDALNQQFAEYKEEFYGFIEKAMKR